MSSLGARTCQMIFSGGFCDVGVKNDATAVSVDVLAFSLILELVRSGTYLLS